MHRTNRNIMRGVQQGAVLDLHAGPSDDDFSYKRDHTTFAHDGEHANDARIGVKVVFTEAASAEVQWGTGERAECETSLDGYVNLSERGLALNLWTGEDDQEIPLHVELRGNELRVFAFEGEPPESQRDAWCVFDSTKLDPNDPLPIRARLEYLRGELRAERISMSELVELQGLAEYIEPGDVELLEAAGVPEHEERDT